MTFCVCRYVPELLEHLQGLDMSFRETVMTTRYSLLRFKAQGRREHVSIMAPPHLCFQCCSYGQGRLKVDDALADSTGLGAKCCRRLLM